MKNKPKIEEAPRISAAQNPLYAPKKKSLAREVLKKARSQRELWILAEILRRPYP